MTDTSTIPHRKYESITARLREENEAIPEDSDLMETRYGPRPKGTKGERFTDAQREHHFVTITERVLKGVTFYEIARELGMSIQGVYYYYKIIKERWQEASLRNFDEIRALELAKLDRLEKEYWESWERSKRPKTQTTQRTAPTKANSDDVRVTAGMKTEDRDGDPRFLDGVFKCIERRIKLFGLDEAEKIAMVGAFSVGEDNDLSRRLARYNDALTGASIDVATATVVSYRAGQPVDSERPPSAPSNILDVGGPGDGRAAP